MKRYAFRRYNKSAVSIFNKERARLQKIIGVPVVIEHIGSTAVPGLGGKGVIDIEILVPKNKIKKICRLLQSRYLFRPLASAPERLFFRTDYENKKVRPIHIHLVIDKKDLAEKIAFRDYLRLHPKDARRYEAIKKRALKFAKGKGKLYLKYKENFIKHITKKAL